MTRAKSLLLVHGHNFKPQESVLRELSVAALRSGVERDYPHCLAAFDALHTDLAWYGDLNAAVLQARGKNYDEDLDVGDRRNALQELQKVTPRKKFGIRQYDSLPGKSALPEFFVGIVAPVLGALGFDVPLVGRLAADFGAYFDTDSDYGGAVRQRVRKQLCKLMQRGDEIMLVTHGTGSVIAYDVLWELSNEQGGGGEYAGCKVEQWVTLGSPLGDRVVQRRLLGAGEKSASRFPGNVITWHNLAAEDDYTCHDNTLADDFKKMLQQRRVSAVHDYRVFNLAVRYGRSNPHSAVGYLIHPRMAKIVTDWLG